MALPRLPAWQGKLEEEQAREAVQSAPPGYLGLALGERVSVRHIGLGGDQGFSYTNVGVLEAHWRLGPGELHWRLAPIP